MRKTLIVTATALLALVATPTMATGQPVKPNPFTQVVAPPVVHQIGVYVYDKINPDAPASWENSGTQHLVTVADGTEWVQIDWRALLPKDACGDDAKKVGVQEDALEHDGTFVFPQTLTPPTGLAVHPYKSIHYNLADLVELPACEAYGHPDPDVDPDDAYHHGPQGQPAPG
jgi:hypothetical protein